MPSLSVVVLGHLLCAGHSWKLESYRCTDNKDNCSPLPLPNGVALR